MIFGFLVNEPAIDVARRAAACAAAVEPIVGGRLHCRRIGNAVVGQWRRSDSAADADPAVSSDGKRALWFEGEAFAGPPDLGSVDVQFSQSRPFRERLLALIDRRGWSALESLDGEFAVVVWDAESRRLSVAVDRFGLKRVFWGAGPKGFAFGSRVAAVLAGSDVQTKPNLDALRDAVTAGGYPLAPQTYVKDVRLAPPHSVISSSIDGSVDQSRYWSWSALRKVSAISTSEVVERSESLWTEAMKRRTSDGLRFVQTLSGGLDSRVILDDGSSRTDHWTAVSYGLPGCDDCNYAQAAAASVDVRWIFHPLYSGKNPPWYERRLDWVLRTDGLVDFGNLMHTEVVDLLAANGDGVLHGSLGDFVCGPTFQSARTTDDLVLLAPYYGGPLAWSLREYAERLDALSPVDLPEPRLAYCEQKFTSLINPLFTSIQHVARLRRPFADHAFFDFWQSLPSEHRDGRTYRTWLSAKHARVFAEIPWQKTGLPIDAGKWRLTWERGRRFAMRKMVQGLPKVWLTAAPRRRQFFDDEAAMRIPEVRDLVQQTVLSPNAVAANAWNRTALHELIDRWHESAAAPVQQIGALLSFEYYHRQLPAQLRRLRASPPLKEMPNLDGATGSNQSQNADCVMKLNSP